MKITRRKDGRYQVVLPAEESPTGKRQAKYFNYKTSDRDDRMSAERFIKEHEANRRVHGEHAVTPEELHWINIARNALGSLPKLGEVLEHWRKTGANIHSISARDGVEEFLKWKIASNHLKPRTVSDTRSRLRNFGKYFGDTPFNQITPESLDDFLLTRKEGGDRRSYWKRIKPMFKYASTIKNWIAVNPLDKLETPAWGTPKRGIYTPDQYAKLIAAAQLSNDEIALRYMVLMGTGFLRFEELVGTQKSDVLKWEDVQLDRFIDVRKEVAKSTRRAEGDGRQINLIKGESLHTYLVNQLELDKTLTGKIIPISDKQLRDRMNVIFALANVKQVPNGFRHSAISYYLAMFPDVGVSRVSVWAGNSEATIRKHYLQVLRKEQGEDWFAAVNQLIRF
jgi:site-specific recombinase XerD